MVVKNKDVRSWLEKRAKTPQPADLAKMPVQGLYMFDQMGPAAVIDFALSHHFDAKEYSFDHSLADFVASQSGVPATKYGGLGPYLPGGWMAKGMSKAKYTARFYCPEKLGGDNFCLLTESLFGGAFHNKDELRTQGPMFWK